MDTTNVVLTTSSQLQLIDYLTAAALAGLVLLIFTFIVFLIVTIIKDNFLTNQLKIKQL